MIRFEVNPCRACRGFTLVDLFVVIVIFGLVAAVLVSVVEHLREPNYRLNCSDNMNRIGSAIRGYAEDNDGALPDALTEMTRTVDNRRLVQRTTWENRITNYFPDNHPEFPVCADRQLPGSFAGNADKPEYSGYAYNANLSQTRVRQTPPASSVARSNAITSVGGRRLLDFPSLVVEILEARTGMVALSAPDTLSDVIGGFADNATADLVRSQSPGALRHGDGANYAFVDGHVRWYVPSGISAKPKCDGVHPGMGI